MCWYTIPIHELASYCKQSYNIAIQALHIKSELPELAECMASLHNFLTFVFISLVFLLIFNAVLDTSLPVYQFNISRNNLPNSSKIMDESK